MSHIIKKEIYPENVNKNEVQKFWDTVVMHEDYREGAIGLFSPIRWMSQIILDSYEDAEEYIAIHDRGDYDSLAVCFKDIEVKKSKKLINLEVKLEDLEQKYIAKKSVCYATSVKSEYIGCKHCGSKLASKFLQETNKCPLCKEDLRSATTLTAIEKLKSRILEVRKQIEEENNRLRKIQEKNAKINWLVKVEYHI